MAALPSDSPADALYPDAPVPIRDDLRAAHRATVESWASPGNHWTAAERLAIVAEVRGARAADEMPPWVAPTTVDGLVADRSLPDPAIDAVWRLTNHSATLTADWHRTIIDRGITPLQYVELVAIVAAANCLEVFATALGIESIPLPGPAEGEADGLVPDGAGISTHWVPTVATRGANVTRALTAVPVATGDWQRLSAAQYVPPEALVKDLTWSRGPLDRRQTELLAARTSLLNECFY